MRLEEVGRYVAGELRRGSLNLFTGAGFSSDATDRRGRSIPTGAELADELWAMCFPNEERDRDSSLEDLFHVALDYHRPVLERLLERRLTVDPSSLPDWYERWFALPWRRIYTVNVDDLESAVAARFRLPRPIVAVSALDPSASCAAHPLPGVLEVVHLNGMLAGGPERVTFSTRQYGSRLAHQDDCYRRLAADLEQYPFVFVGTRLDESPLWQHLDGKTLDRSPRSFLVTQAISRARQHLLEGMNIEWVAQSAAQFACGVLARLERKD